VKWIIAFIGAVFVTLLAGVQFNRLPFFSDPVVAGAGLVAAAGVMAAFHLAIRVLVGDSISYEELVAGGKFAAARRFIDDAWKTETFAAFAKRLSVKDEEWRARKIEADDPDYARMNRQAAEFLSLAKWYVAKARYRQLVLAVTFLLPIELVAAAFMFGATDDRPDTDKTVITIERPRAD